MKIAILGSGGREHAIAVSISKSKKIEKIYCIPGNAGTSEIAINICINLDDFENLYSYSPYHNIQRGVCYPPTLITTSDRDDRVVPSHSYKFAARLQSLQSCDNKIMLRVETRSGHGAGIPRDKQIDEIADIYGAALSFIQ